MHIYKQGLKSTFTKRVRSALRDEPGLTVKDPANRLRTNRKFMAGVLTVLEEASEVYHRPNSPARIYFNLESENHSSEK